MATFLTASRPNAIPSAFERRLSDELRIALQSLGHPVTLACVALLLLNDHVLKSLVPSVLTGKLSDFAGLFFFPYLVVVIGAAGALAAGRLARRRLPERQARRLPPATAAYLGTALLFSLIKLHPPAAAGVSDVLSALFGDPIYVAPDPSDVIALLALLPSFWLWRSVERSERRRPGKRSILALGIAALAAIATSPCMEPPTITHLVGGDKGVYAVTADYGTVSNTYLSADQGLSWDYVDPDDLPPSVVVASDGPAPLPKIECVPGLEQICYRVAGEEKLEASTDSGLTWEVVWSVPASRREYMERAATGASLLLECGKDLDVRANDLAVLGDGADHLVLVATGNEGVLRGRFSDPEWERQGVSEAQPTPIQGRLSDLLFPWIILGESFLAVAAGGVTFMLLSVLSWRRLERESTEAAYVPPSKRSISLVGGILLALVVLAVILTSPVLGIGIFCAPFILLIGLAAYMARRWRLSGWHSKLGRQLFWATALGSLLVLSLAWVPVALWVLGVIPGYTAAFSLGWIAAGVAFVWSLRRVRSPWSPLQALS